MRNVRRKIGQIRLEFFRAALQVTCVLAAACFVSLWSFLPALAGEFDEPVLQSQGLTAMTAPTEAYWTAERMQNARAMPLPRVSAALPQSLEDIPTEPSGPTIIAASGGPGESPTERVLEPSEIGSLDFVPQANPGQFAFTRYRLFPNVTELYKQFPYVFVGKVFFTIPGQGDFVCTGSVVNAPNLSLVWTAGHCVYTPGVGFHSNFVFVPARHEGTNPYALWTANTLGTTNGWATAGLFEYDHGAAFMNPGGPGLGNHLIGSQGFLGFAANLPRQQHWHLHGYPAAPPFDGEHHQICATTWATNDQPTGTPGVDPEAIGVGCDQTGGSSGGPWIIDLSGETGNSNIVNGNNSYTYLGIGGRMYGPYFGNAAINLRDSLGNM